MREIRFRVWDFRENRLHYSESMSQNNGFFLNADGKVIRCADGGDTWADLEEEEGRWMPMLFTGLYDSKGKEIYEGDVVALNNVITGAVGLNPGFTFSEEERFAIKWDDSIAGWSFDFGSKNDQDRVDVAWRNQVRSLIVQGHCSVVGNIYERPSLVPEAK